MPENTTAEPADTTEYAWLITLQIPADNGFELLTTMGTYTAGPGDTRRGVYQDIRAWLTQQNPALERTDVLFFSLEPNRL